MPVSHWENMKFVLAAMPGEKDHKVIMMTLECLHFTVMLLQVIKMDDFLGRIFTKNLLCQPCHFYRQEIKWKKYFFLPSVRNITELWNSLYVSSLEWSCHWSKVRPTVSTLYFVFWIPKYENWIGNFLFLIIFLLNQEQLEEK